MSEGRKIIKDDLLYPELSYKIVGVLFEVFNSFGPGHNEKYYQKGIAIGLKQNGLNFQKELAADLYVFGEKAGTYYLDFLVEQNIVLEIKRGSRLFKRDVDQVKAYLEAKGLQLGILALFQQDGVKCVRIINWQLVKEN